MKISLSVKKSMETITFLFDANDRDKRITLWSMALPGKKAVICFEDHSIGPENNYIEVIPVPGLTRLDSVQPIQCRLRCSEVDGPLAFTLEMDFDKPIIDFDLMVQPGASPTVSIKTMHNAVWLSCIQEQETPSEDAVRDAVSPADAPTTGESDGSDDPPAASVPIQKKPLPAPPPVLPPPEEPNSATFLVDGSDAFYNRLEQYFKEFLKRTGDKITPQLRDYSGDIQRLEDVLETAQAAADRMYKKVNPETIVAEVQKKLAKDVAEFTAQLQRSVAPEDLADQVLKECGPVFDGKLDVQESAMREMRDGVEERIEAVMSAMAAISANMDDMLPAVQDAAARLAAMTEETARHTGPAIGLDVLLNGIRADLIGRVERLAGGGPPVSDEFEDAGTSLLQAVSAIRDGLARFVEAAGDEAAADAREVFANLADRLEQTGRPRPGPLTLPPWEAFITTRLEAAVRGDGFSIGAALTDYFASLDDAVLAYTREHHDAMEETLAVSADEVRDMLEDAVCRHLLPILDRAYASGEDRPVAAADELAATAGIELIHPPRGAAFDDRLHEAAGDLMEGEIGEVRSSGWTRQGRILRKAVVELSAGAAVKAADGVVTPKQPDPYEVPSAKRPPAQEFVNKVQSALLPERTVDSDDIQAEEGESKQEEKEESEPLILAPPPGLDEEQLFFGELG